MHQTTRASNSQQKKRLFVVCCDFEYIFCHRVLGFVNESEATLTWQQNLITQNDWFLSIYSMLLVPPFNIIKETKV